MILWLMGNPFSGKTNFANQFPNPHFISLDKNAQYITENFTNVNTIDDFNKALEDVLQGRIKCDTLVIDTLDLVETFIRTYFLDKLEIEDESDMEDYGYAWRVIREGTKKAVQKITEFDGNVILISHAQEKTKVVNKILGTEVTETIPVINPKIHNFISGLTTVVARTFKDEKKIGKELVTRYMLSIGHDPNELAGTRLELKETLIEQDYQTFVENFKNKKLAHIKGDE